MNVTLNVTLNPTLNGGVTAIGGSWRRATSSPGELVTRAALYTLIVATLAGIWRAAAAAKGAAGIAGYDGKSLTWYVAASEAATVATNSKLIEHVANTITGGDYATELLRPGSALRQRIATEVGSILPRLAVIAATGFALAWITAGAPPHAGALVLAAPALVLAVICNVVAQHLFAGFAFWFRNTGAAWFVYQKFVFMIGGMLLPIEVRPRILETAARFSPFTSMAYAPARLASGHPTPWLLAMQLGWIAVLSLLCSFVYALGERRIAEGVT